MKKFILLLLLFMMPAIGFSASIKKSTLASQSFFKPDKGKAPSLSTFLDSLPSKALGIIDILENYLNADNFKDAMLLFDNSWDKVRYELFYNNEDKKIKDKKQNLMKILIRKRDEIIQGMIKKCLGHKYNTSNIQCAVILNREQEKKGYVYTLKDKGEARELRVWVRGSNKLNSDYDMAFEMPDDFEAELDMSLRLKRMCIDKYSANFSVFFDAHVFTSCYSSDISQINIDEADKQDSAHMNKILQFKEEERENHMKYALLYIKQACDLVGEDEWDNFKPKFKKEILQQLIENKLEVKQDIIKSLSVENIDNVGKNIDMMFEDVEKIDEKLKQELGENYVLDTLDTEKNMKRDQMYETIMLESNKVFKSYLQIKKKYDQLIDDKGDIKEAHDLKIEMSKQTLKFLLHVNFALAWLDDSYANIGAFKDVVKGYQGKESVYLTNHDLLCSLLSNLGKAIIVYKKEEWQSPQGFDKKTIAKKSMTKSAKYLDRIGRNLFNLNSKELLTRDFMSIYSPAERFMSVKKEKGDISWEDMLSEWEEKVATDVSFEQFNRVLLGSKDKPGLAIKFACEMYIKELSEKGWLWGCGRIVEEELLIKKEIFKEKGQRRFTPDLPPISPSMPLETSKKTSISFSGQLSDQTLDTSA